MAWSPSVSFYRDMSRIVQGRQQELATQELQRLQAAQQLNNSLTLMQAQGEMEKRTAENTRQQQIDRYSGWKDSVNSYLEVMKGDDWFDALSSEDQRAKAYASYTGDDLTPEEMASFSKQYESRETLGSEAELARLEREAKVREASPEHWGKKMALLNAQIEALGRKDQPTTGKATQWSVETASRNNAGRAFLTIRKGLMEQHMQKGTPFIDDALLDRQALKMLERQFEKYDGDDLGYGAQDIAWVRDKGIRKYSEREIEGTAAHHIGSWATPMEEALVGSGFEEDSEGLISAMERILFDSIDSFGPNPPFNRPDITEYIANWRTRVEASADATAREEAVVGSGTGKQYLPSLAKDSGLGARNAAIAAASPRDEKGKLRGDDAFQSLYTRALGEQQRDNPVAQQSLADISFRYKALLKMSNMDFYSDKQRANFAAGADNLAHKLWERDQTQAGKKFTWSWKDEGGQDIINWDLDLGNQSWVEVFGKVDEVKRLLHSVTDQAWLSGTQGAPFAFDMARGLKSGDYDRWYDSYKSASIRKKPVQAAVDEEGEDRAAGNRRGLSSGSVLTHMKSQDFFRAIASEINEGQADEAGLATAASLKPQLTTDSNGAARALDPRVFKPAMRHLSRLPMVRYGGALGEPDAEAMLSKGFEYVRSRMLSGESNTSGGLYERSRQMHTEAVAAMDGNPRTDYRRLGGEYRERTWRSELGIHTIYEFMGSLDRDEKEELTNLFTSVEAGLASTNGAWSELNETDRDRRLEEILLKTFKEVFVDGME